MPMDAIVNVTPDWGIGRENALLVSISADLRRFRALTAGKTLILGRKTLETFPQKKPLKGRKHLILSKSPNFTVENAQVFHNLPALLSHLRTLPREELCVVGGESVYRALLPYCDRALVTKTFLHAEADRFFPDLDALPEWCVTASSAPQEENGMVFQFIDYVNQNPQLL